MQELEVEGKTVTLAVAKGLAELGMRRDEVEVQVLEEGIAGFLGIGSKQARVRIRKRGAGESSSSSATPPAKRPAGKSPDAACAAARATLAQILKLAGVADAAVTCRWDAEQERILAEIETADGGLVIGKGGRTLEALQFLMTIVVGREVGAPTAVQVETQGYWKKIEDKILAEADKAVAEVKRTGEPYRFEPMEPSLRRLLHRRLGSCSDVETTSEGEGPWRKVVVKPRAN